jgi:hypothetical protein
LGHFLRAQNLPTLLSIHKPAPASAERNAILKAIVSHPELSIYALNASMDYAMGATPLVLACRLGRVELVTILLERPSVLVNARDASGLTPLMRKALSISSKNRTLMLSFPQFSTDADAVHTKSLRIVSALVSLSRFKTTPVLWCESLHVPPCTGFIPRIP